MDSSLGLSMLLLFIIFGVIGGFIFKLWLDERNATKRRQEILSMANENATEEPVRRPRRQFVDRTPSSEVEEENVNDDENLDDQTDFDEDTKKVGKKKLAKLQAKAEAKAKREAEQTERAEKRKREEEKTREEDARRAAQEEEERKRLAKLKAEQEEKKRRELEEYNKMKVAFSVEEQGFDLDECESENLMQSFLDYIKRSKVIYVDELSTRFSLKVEDSIERINQFIADKMLNGVFDDRGKFICITDDELKAVAKFINQRGRVSVQELVDYSNRLISLEPLSNANNTAQECI